MSNTQTNLAEICKAAANERGRYWALIYVVLLACAIVSIMAFVAMIEEGQNMDQIRRTIILIGTGFIAIIGLIYITTRCDGSVLYCLMLVALLAALVYPVIRISLIAQDEVWEGRILSYDALRQWAIGSSALLFLIIGGSLLYDFSNILFPKPKSNLEIGAAFTKDFMDRLPADKAAEILGKTGDIVSEFLGKTKEAVLKGAEKGAEVGSRVMELYS